MLFILNFLAAHLGIFLEVPVVPPLPSCLLIVKGSWSNPGSSFPTPAQVSWIHRPGVTFLSVGFMYAQAFGAGAGTRSQSCWETAARRVRPWVWSRSRSVWVSACPSCAVLLDAVSFSRSDHSVYLEALGVKPEVRDPGAFSMEPST